MASCGDTLLYIRKRLIAAGCDAPEMEADILLALTLGVSRSRLLAMRSTSMPNDQLAKLEALLARRVTHEPLAYVTGSMEFYGRSFDVEPGVLIPRVDTEVIVDATLEVARAHPNPVLRILDLGVGSGCILLTLLAELPKATGVGVDLSPLCLKVCSRNAEKLVVQSRVALREGNWFEPLTGDEAFDLIVSNPPYVAEKDRESLQPEVRDHEPPTALFANDDGLEHYRPILSGAKARLQANGAVILEVGFDQSKAVSDTARHLGFEVETRRDTAGIERVVIARMRG
ncbi:MAG: peptide chain release factor N(5)-glutamine methyltransferase [Planctomycetaceae bacterium]|nr:peptide chain release factor N(5)-glutamine methyltransferase [Planctomycetaceae bacterium]